MNGRSRTWLSTPFPFADEPLDRVGDLQLVATGRLDRRDRVVDRRAEEVRTDEREVALRLLRLLDQADEPTLRVELGHPELLRVGRPASSSTSASGEVRVNCVDEIRDATDDEVVAEIHEERLVAEEVPGDEHRVGEAAGASWRR